MTFIDTPTDAMIKANSPICARLIPDCTAIFKFCPDNKTPIPEKIGLNTNTTNVMSKIVPQCSNKIFGSTNIPTETKNTAPKKSFKPFIKCSIRAPSIVSDKIEPIINAPNAAEKPTLTANTTIPRHNPNEIMSNISSVIRLRIRLKNDGRMNIPTRNHSTMKKPNLKKLSIISMPSNC